MSEIKRQGYLQMWGARECYALRCYISIRDLSNSNRELLSICVQLESELIHLQRSVIEWECSITQLKSSSIRPTPLRYGKMMEIALRLNSLIESESSLIHLESSQIQLEGYLIQVESSLIKLESSLIQLKSSLIQLNSTANELVCPLIVHI